MRVRLYKPGKTAMQSGRARTAKWVLEPELPTARVAEPLMGWQSSGDTLNQISLKFDDKESALRFAEQKGWHVIADSEKLRVIQPRNYSDNFRG